ncbi:MAG TPA: hypothetical protein DCZ43_01500, partial [candidate division Zixibacteria bacterium]|nr:hypothetical protein [candidate division Zixibacteria bacterium]
MNRYYCSISSLLVVLFMAPLSMGKWNSSAGLVHDASQASLVGKASIPGKLELKNQVLLSGDCSDFTDLSNLPLPISISGSTADATDEYGTYPEQPICWQGTWYPLSGSGPDVTYKWIAPADSIYEISLWGSLYDTGLEIYNFTCPTEPTYPDDFICGNDDLLFTTSLLDLPLAAGQQIIIVVDGYGNSCGDFELEISFFDTTHVSQECLINTIYGQPGSPADSFGCWTSDENYPGPWMVFDNISNEYQHVCGIEFWGFDWYYNGSTWYECVEDPMEFEVKFYEDDGNGYPGQEVWIGDITPIRTPIENYYGLNRYVSVFDTCITIHPGWISIEGISYSQDPCDCNFIWLDSPASDTICWQAGNNNWYPLPASMSCCFLDSTITPINESGRGLPYALSLLQNYPNPFNA